MIRLLLLLSVSYIASFVSTQTQPSCDSKIFCQGNLLHTVQMARLHEDSKTFVDMALINDETTTLKNFEEFMNTTNQKPTKKQVQRFVNDNFHSFDEFEDWTPPDYTDSPKFLKLIEDPDVKNFAQDLVNIWPTLARKIKQQVLDTPELFTLLPVKRGFIVLGGRFKEFYYWDSYWIIKGLLLNEMYDTVRGMLDNFLSLVDKYGFVPNGSRIYYLNRSQPPLLTLMVASYIQATNNTAWLASNVKTIDKELRFWLDNRLVEVVKGGTTYHLAHYDSESGSPRPESYYEDFITANFYKDEQLKTQLYADLKSGAESGFDFSSRWIIDANGGNQDNLTRLATRKILPVDLNSFLCRAFQKLSEFYETLHDSKNARFWSNKATAWKKAIHDVLYNAEDGIWYDYNVQSGQQRKFFYASNFAPLWSEAYDLAHADEFGRKAAEYFVKQDLMKLKGGIPASLTVSGEQWDYPNAWPPLQHIVIFGLSRSGNEDAKKIAEEFAHRWIQSNMMGYNLTGAMFDKYDATSPGQHGGGGEYEVQVGYGLTNGVALDIISEFYTVKSKKKSGNQ